MDAYVTKPISIDEFYLTIEKLAPAASSAHAEKGPVFRDDVINLSAILTLIENDLELLEDLVSIFKENYPQRMAAIKEAITNVDSLQLEREAHALKGMISYFSAAKAVRAAYRLEEMGRNGNVGQAADIFPSLEKEITALERALEEFLISMNPDAT